MTNKIIFPFLAICGLLYSCSPSPTETSTEAEAPVVTAQPRVEDYALGETWTWEWKRAVNGEVLGSGEDILEVVDYQGELGFWNNFDTVKVSARLNQEPSSTPFRDWPLAVGKKWLYESEWTNEAGDGGKTRQQAEILSYGELAVAAGTFMAYEIRYEGTIENYAAGGAGQVIDTWWYSPELKTHLKHVQDGGDGFVYVSELIGYTNAKSKWNY